MTTPTQVVQPIWPHVVMTALSAAACGYGIFAVVAGRTPRSGDELQQVFGLMLLVDFGPALLLALIGLATRKIGMAVVSFLLLLFGAMGGPLLTLILMGSLVH